MTKYFMRIVILVIQKLALFFGICFGGTHEHSLLERYSLIPQPVELIPAQGEFTITPATQIIGTINDDEARNLVRWMAHYLGTCFGKSVSWSKERTSEKGNIVIRIDPLLVQEPEGYQLLITPDYIKINAHASVGVFYAFQTLRQLLPASAERQVPLAHAQLIVPCVAIKDYPRFSYRGLMLDVARHMMPIASIKKMIDVMARYKLNTLHWHLTDDQGWRIEIKRYPQLQEVAAYRRQTLVGRSYAQPQVFDGQCYGGYYTQEEIKEIVAYAQQRYITVVPEIEFPGHCLAALAAYPELGCTGHSYATSTRWGIHEDVYCAGNEKVFAFAENVLAEVSELFPGKYIHIGGDEVRKNRWEQCAACQQRIRVECLKNGDELQSYFIKRIEKIVNALGRSIIGWDEILEGGLAPHATVMSWLGTEGGTKAAQIGHDVIMTPHEYMYFDYYQSKNDDEPLAMGRFLPLRKVYDYEPVPQELTALEANHILGVQANVWTEYIATPEHLQYMVFPRALALAEVAWTPRAQKEYSCFIKRAQRNIWHLKALGVQYADHGL